VSVDISTRADVEAVVQAFYDRAMADPLIGPVFTDVAQLDLPAHLPIMGDFWESVLFRTGRYQRNAFSVHRSLHERCALTPEHFDRWLALWTSTIDRLYGGPVAERAKLQARRVADSMSRRLNGRPVVPDGAELHAGRPEQRTAAVQVVRIQTRPIPGVGSRHESN